MVQDLAFTLKKKKKKSIQTTTDTHLRWFRFGLYPEFFQRADSLFLRKRLDSPHCSLCNQEDESTDHLPWNCNVTLSFRRDLQSNIGETCVNCRNMEFSETLIWFDVAENVLSDEVLALIILLFKFHIYKCKWQKRRPTVKMFLRILKDRYEVERYLQNR